ncbi:MAG: hypothetical protein MJK04_26950, partial [Psychrosphaera sp.]|nr:hypothetical protein [Psychrosphaera sp.]
KDHFLVHYQQSYPQLVQGSVNLPFVGSGMTEKVPIKADERRFSHLNQAHSTTSGTFSAIPLRAVAILPETSDRTNSVTARSNMPAWMQVSRVTQELLPRITMSLSQCLVIEQNGLQQTHKWKVNRPC